MSFYSRREPEEPEDPTKGRDVFNEKPPADELLAVSELGKAVTTSLPDNVVSSFIFILPLLSCHLVKPVTAYNFYIQGMYVPNESLLNE